MSNSELLPVDLPKGTLAIFGFGFHRLQTDNPLFHRTDYEEALPVTVRRSAALSKAYISTMQKVWSEAGYVSLHTDRSGFGRPRILMELGTSAIDPMVEALVRRTTHTGANLVDLLYVPESVKAVLNHTHFIDRVLAQVSGMPFKRT